jgi:hypothetical protein
MEGVVKVKLKAKSVIKRMFQIIIAAFTFPVLCILWFDALIQLDKYGIVEQRRFSYISPIFILLAFYGFLLAFGLYAIVYQSFIKMKIKKALKIWGIAFFLLIVWVGFNFYTNYYVSVYRPNVLLTRYANNLTVNADFIFILPEWYSLFTPESVTYYIDLSNMRMHSISGLDTGFYELIKIYDLVELDQQDTEPVLIFTWEGNEIINFVNAYTVLEERWRVITSFRIILSDGSILRAGRFYPVEIE